MRGVRDIEQQEPLSPHVHIKRGPAVDSHLGQRENLLESCSLQLLGWVQRRGEEKPSVCGVSTCWSRQNIWCVCGRWKFLPLLKGMVFGTHCLFPHHTPQSDTAVLFFSGPQNGPHYCVCLSQTPTFNPHFVSGSFQPSIYSLLNQFFPPIVKTASEFCIGVLLQGVLWKPLMWSCMWFLPQCCGNVAFSDREVFGKFLVIVLWLYEWRFVSVVWIVKDLDHPKNYNSVIYSHPCWSIWLWLIFKTQIKIF